MADAERSAFNMWGEADYFPFSEIPSGPLSKGPQLKVESDLLRDPPATAQSFLCPVETANLQTAPPLDEGKYVSSPAISVLMLVFIFTLLLSIVNMAAIPPTK